MNIAYIKSFSKGQITIPKEMRKALGVYDEFWLKLTLEEGKLVAEPVEQKKDKAAYRKKLLTLKPIDIDMNEIKQNRKQIEEQIQKRAL